MSVPIGVDATQCWSNLTDDSGVGIVSQNFEAPFDAYDNAGADDVTFTKKCKMKRVIAYGAYFNGTGPAASETLTVYADPGGMPGDIVTTQTVAGKDDAGTFTLNLKKTTLKKGTYWFSIVANLDGTLPGGEWGWETTHNQVGNPALWQNPGDGYGTGCTTWANMVTCIGAAGQGPDFMFKVRPLRARATGGYKIDTYTSCADVCGSLGPFGNPDTATYGQTFTAPDGVTTFKDVM